MLLLAIAASLLLHLILAFVVRWPSPRDAQPQDIAVTHARIIRIRHVAKVVRPPAKPHPHRTSAPAILKHPVPKRVAPPRLTHAAAGRAAAAASAAATSVPSPEPSAAACSAPNAPAALAGSPPPAPSILPDVRARAASGITRVAVRLSPSGRVLDARVAASSGSPSLDVAAVSMAKAATYAPAYVKCKAVVGAYTFSVKWAAW